MSSAKMIHSVYGSAAVAIAREMGLKLHVSRHGKPAEMGPHGAERAMAMGATVSIVVAESPLSPEETPGRPEYNPATAFGFDIISARIRSQS